MTGQHEWAGAGHRLLPALPSAVCGGEASRLPGFVFQVVLVSSSLSDRDQSLFLSTDEGATFQKQLVPFSVETLIFHPKEEDKVLAYSKESTVSRPGLERGWCRGQVQPSPRGLGGPDAPALGRLAWEPSGRR